MYKECTWKKVTVDILSLSLDTPPPTPQLLLTALSRMKLVDLTYTLSPRDSSLWPGNSPLSLTRVSPADSICANVRL